MSTGAKGEHPALDGDAGVGEGASFGCSSFDHTMEEKMDHSKVGRKTSEDWTKKQRCCLWRLRGLDGD